MSASSKQADNAAIAPGVRDDRRNRPAASGLPAASSLAGRLIVSCLFWTLCLTLTAAGHRLYKATVAVDRAVSANDYKSDGAPLVWVGYGNIQDAARRVSPHNRTIDAGKLTALPNSLFLLAAAAAYTLLGGFAAWSGRWIANNGVQSLAGLFAGHFLWLGAIEFGLAAAGRRLGLAGSLEVVEGRVVGSHGAGILIQLSVVFLVPMLIGLTMHESNRCAVFQWFRRRLPILRSPAASGRVENYAARTAIQYFMTVWFCYVGVLWLADQRLGQVGQVGLLLTLAAIAVATPYLIWRTAHQPGRAQAFRYSVSGAVVAWTGIEIAAAMQFFHEPWLSNSVLSGVVLLGLSILLTVIAGQQLVSAQALIAAPPVRATVGLLAVALTLAGCDRPGNSSNRSPAEIGQSLRRYEQLVQQPQPAAHDGLLHALGSPDPATRAQAALAFGKSQRVTSVVQEQLRAMALADESPLSRFAALRTLHRLDLISPELQDVMQELNDDPDWRPLVIFVGS